MSFDFEALGKALEKAVGGNDASSEVSVWLDTGFAPLNFAISNNYNNGLPCGRIVEIFGPPSCGKTALLTNAMIAAQGMEGIACLHDHERAFYTELGKKLGLSTDLGKWLFKQPRTFEESLDKYVDTVRTIRKNGLELDKPIMYGFDSLASMIPKSQLEKGMSAMGMHDKLALAAATSPTFRVLASIAEEFNVCTTFLNQIRQKPGVMFGDPTTTPGGTAPEFYASLRIQLAAKRLYPASEKKAEGKTPTAEDMVPIGQEVKAVVTKNKLNRPFLKAKWKFLFKPDGSGYFDAVGSTLDFMIDKGVIDGKSTKGWIKWLDGSSYRRSELVKKIVAEGGDQELRRILTASGVEPDVEEPIETDE